MLAVPGALPAPQPELDTYASAGQMSVELDTETTRLLLGAVPAAFHAGVQDILLIAFGLAWAEFLGTAAPIGIDVEGHGRHDDLAGEVDLSRTVGWFTTKYPVALGVGGLDWAQVLAGEAVLGAVIKDAKEQLRALPDGLTYGLLRYLNPEVDLTGADPAIGFNYLGRLGASATELSDDLWQLSRDGASMAAAAAAIPMPLGHTVELNAGTLDTDTGPHLHATWTWAPSTIDDEQVNRLSQLWFDALAGICAHVQRGGGGLTPSDIVPARLSQQQIDELCRQDRIADILPLTPLQQGLLFHANTIHGNTGDVYAMQLDITITGSLDADRLREAVRIVLTRHPNLAARFCRQFDQPVQVIPADPEPAWQYLDLGDTAAQVDQVSAAERTAVCDLSEPPAFRVALIHTVETFTGWCSPITTSCSTAGRCRSWRRRSSPAISGTDYPRPRPIAGLSAGWPNETSVPPGRPGERRSRALTFPPWWDHRDRWAGAARGRDVSGQSADDAGAQRAGSLASHHRQYRVAGRLGPAADVADRPARRRLRHRGIRSAYRCPARNRWWAC